MSICKIIIEVAGGVVQAVRSDYDDIDVEIIDYDNEPEQNPPDTKQYHHVLL